MFKILKIAIVLTLAGYIIRQCRRPTGWGGKLIISLMNRGHAGLIAWGLKHAEVTANDTILDIGCGGGLLIQTLSSIATNGKICGVDISDASVDAARTRNQAAIETGRVDIQQASVSLLPFPNNTFDLITAVETHYYWPDRPRDMQEILRVLKPGGRLMIVAEVYRGRSFDAFYSFGMKLIGGAYLTPDEHRDLFVQAGYADAEVFLEPRKGWICAAGRKPS